MRTGNLRPAYAMLVALAVALPMTASAQTPSPAASQRAEGQPPLVYLCRTTISNFDGAGSILSLGNSFHEDGSVARMGVNLSESHSGVIRRNSEHDQAFLTLSWPGDHRFSREPRPFDWADGSIDVSFHAQATNRNVYRTGERWRQVIIDRNHAVRVHEEGSARWLLLSGLDMPLASELVDLASPGRLHMSIDSLLAWGSGAETMSVYEALVTPHPPRQNHPDSPAGPRRVVGEYDVDVPALARLIARIREAMTAWEASLTDFRARCTRGVDDADVEVVIPDSRIRRPASRTAQ